MPEATFFLPFSLIFPGGGRAIDQAREKKERTKEQQLKHTAIETKHHHHSRDLGSAPSLESL
jgi:hypothetical protein